MGMKTISHNSTWQFSLGAIWDLIKGTGLPCLGHQSKGHKCLSQKGLHVLGP